MGVEIERKFLVTGEGWQADAEPGMPIRQAYLSSGPAASVRVRIVGESAARLTVKSAGAALSRCEFEYDVPVADAAAMLALRQGAVIVKTRYRIAAGEGRAWEIDVFGGVHAGLVIAEIELGAEDEAFARPDWLGAEVTSDPAYSNAALALA